MKIMQREIQQIYHFSRNGILKAKNLWKIIDNYLFERVSEQRVNAMQPIAFSLVQSPMTTIKCIKFEINMALIFNIIVLSIFYFNLDIILYNNLDLNYIILAWSFYHSFLNFISILPKLILIFKINLINLNSLTHENLIDNIKIFLFSRIYYFNQLLSKTILISYAIGFIFSLSSYIYQGIYQGKETDSETKVSSQIVLCFLIRLTISIIRSIFFESQYEGLNQKTIDNIPFKEITQNKVEELAKNQIICSICIETFQVGQKVRELSCSGKHLFHQNCVDKWLLIQNRCPNCNGLASKEL